MKLSLPLTVAAPAVVAPHAFAITVPFTETFASSNSGWTNSANAAIGWNATGGPDNSGFISTTFNLTGQPDAATPVLVRGQAGASGGLFTGDWIAAGVTQVSVDVRHSATAPLTMFARFAQAPAPGAIMTSSFAVPANQWTTLTFDINPTNPLWLNFEGSSYAAVLSNIQRIQFGVVVSAAANLTGPYTLDVDNVRVIPAPSIGALAGLASLVAMRRKRN